jgi:hypothetical protein
MFSLNFHNVGKCNSRSVSQKSDYNQLRMNQRHYSPDQLNLQQRSSSLKKSSKRLRDGGSTTKLLESTSRYC